MKRFVLTILVSCTAIGMNAQVMKIKKNSVSINGSSIFSDTLTVNAPLESTGIILI